MRYVICILLLCIAGPAWAVKTSHWIHTSQADFDRGTLSHVVATNLGDLKLARKIQPMLGEDPRISAVFSLAQSSDGTIYAGTGPSGVLLSIKNDQVTTAAEIGQHLSIFSLLMDSQGRLLIGTGGEKGQVLRIDRPGAPATPVFSAPGVQYIWALVQTSDQTIYAATGPNGQLFQINPDGSNKVLFDSDENNLLCLLSDGADQLYIGTDPNGLLYRLNRKTGEVYVVYDAPESEISALARDSKGNLFAGTSDARPSSDHPDEAAPQGRPEGGPLDAPIVEPPPSRPEPPSIPSPAPGEPLPIPRAVRPISMVIDDPTPEPPAITSASAPSVAATPSARAARPSSARESATSGNAIYRIDHEGFVTVVFRQPDSVMALIPQDDSLLAATGTDGKLFQVNPSAEETLVLAETDSHDILCLLKSADGRVIMGTANSGNLIAMNSGFAAEGTYSSPALNAGQISRFGKIQLRGTLPAKTGLRIATRSGNVEHIDDPGWSKWTDDQPVAEYVQVNSPPARFLQYRLTFSTTDPVVTPVIQRVNVAYQVPNLPPEIKSVEITSPRKDDDAPATSLLNIKWEPSDPNEDDLEFTLWFRDSTKGPWILLKDKVKDPTFDWDTRNIGDGRYEIKVEASDAAANPVGEGKTTTRVSDPVIVDNTPPVIGDLKSALSGTDIQINLRVVDRTSTVALLEYGVDSAEHWQTVLPADNIADSPEEAYQLGIHGLSSGAHQITLRATDVKGNRSFETVNVMIPANR